MITSVYARRCTAALVAAVLCAPLAACLRGLDVDVSGLPAAPVVSVKPSWMLERARPCIDRAEVRDMNTDEVVWAIEVRGSLACPTLFAITYGHAPEGLTERAPARPLVPGRTYRADVHGQGWLGAVFFKCEADRCRKVEP